MLSGIGSGLNVFQMPPHRQAVACIGNHCPAVQTLNIRNSNEKYSFSYYYGSAFLKPNSAFENLVKDKNLLRFSVIAVSKMAMLCTFVYVFLIYGGGQPFKPWLDIPLNTYYRFNVFFCVPSMFLGWILATGVVHTLSRLIVTAGTFEQSLAVFGFRHCIVDNRYS
jgi:hypothetical protein